MKSRSNNRLQPSDPPDDWVNGSWTVDCICGVTFDDGEEMVNCDECGVWVHTRCFRFAKGEKSFACDKCKNKVSNNNNINDSEETEVAQLLVELPTKTIKMSTSNNNNIHGSFYQSNVSNRSSNSNVFAYSNSTPPLPPRRPPQRLWVKPMEERVHVQGVPGGGDDSSLFKGFPIAFASELWKCTGYIPKKFNFRYREFPCWDDEVEVEHEAKGVDVGGENVVDKGAGVLYSLSKENVVGKEDQGRSGGLDRKGLKDRKLSSDDLKKSSMVSFSKKEKGMCWSISAKRSRDELGSSKDRSEKKKIKASTREDSKKDKGHGFKTVIVQSISARQAEVCESKAHKVASNAHLADGSTIEKIKTNAATDEGNLVLRSFEVSEPSGSSKKEVKAEKPALDPVDRSQKSAITETVPLLNTEKDIVAKNPLKKEEIVLETMDNCQGLISKCQSSDMSKSKTLTTDMDTAAIERNEAEVVKDVETAVSVTSKTKSDTNVDIPKGGMRSLPDGIDVELDSDGMKLCTERISSPGWDCKESNPNETVAASSHEDQDDSKTSKTLIDSQLVKDQGIADNQCNNKVKCEGSDNPVDVQGTSLGSKEAAKVAGKVPKSSEEKLPLPSSHHNAACVGNLSSSSSIVNSRSSLSDKNKAGTSQYPSSTPKRTLSNSSMLIKKENASRVQVKDEDKYEKTKSIVKEHSKSSSTMKASQSSKTVASPVLKHHTSLAKDSMRHPSSKNTSVEISSGNDEPAGSQLTQQGSNGQNKSTSAGNRGEKIHQSNLQSSSKSSQFCHPPPSSIAPAGLSDEELALLLHQELNSSPRVPRVPRVRHTGSLPQISSPSATSIFIKRSTSSGGKEQQTFSRRKNKDGSRRARDQDGEVRKFDRAPSSPDSVKTTDAEAEGASESVHSVRKNAEDISTSAHSGPSTTDANELKSSSIRGSPNNNPEDDTGTNKGQAPPIHRTLPGLIAEIMGEGRRMTYEELCNAVLPHWQNLRKHNGEKYAYSSHSQAVLDCLRNRSEWSRLVDRGPKTNASRKKRKIDVEPPNTESEDGGYRTRRAGKSKSFESNKEEFPKGRRNTRKRRRLALQGRGVRDDRRRTKVEVRSEDSASFSDSSEDTGTSEDDSQESGMCIAKSEVSAS